RWTINRNVQTYLELIAGGRLQIRPLVDRVVAVEETPAVYRELADADGSQPLGVLIRYDHPAEAPAVEPERIVIRGHKAPPDGVLKYALVGAGAFGTAMLVPQMQKRRDRFFLKAVVSRSAAQGGNFVRANRVEVLASDLDVVLKDPSIDLVVIATRHHLH